MNKLNRTGKLIITAVIVVAAILIITKYGGGGPKGTPTASTSTTGASLSDNGTLPSGAAPSGGSISSGGSTPPKAPPITITLITPVPGETWKIASPNPIAWTQEGGVPGQIELLDAATTKLFGVILNQVGPHQTSYTWNTRDVFLSRTNPLKKTVVSGRYLIRLSFDGNNLSPITSQPINLVP